VVEGHCRENTLLGNVLHVSPHYYKELASATMETSPFIFGKVAAPSLSYTPRVSGYQRQIICKKYRHLIWKVTPELTEVTYSLNALLEALEAVNPAELEHVEPLPILLPSA
jgi:hypothetical protein